MMMWKDVGGLKDSNVSRHGRTSMVERHLEDKELGEAINLFLESAATDNDYLAMITQLVELICGDDSVEYGLLYLAMGVPDKKGEDPSVDDFKYCNVHTSKARMIERFNRFRSERNLS